LISHYHLPLTVFALLLGGVAFWPDAVHANQTDRLIGIIKSDAEFTSAWQFIRSLINYAMVGGLLIIAFANVLRINIDTYAVKKILPSLLVGFALANFSLFFGELSLQLASSLSVTAKDFGGLWSAGLTNGLGAYAGGIPMLQ